MTLTPEQERIFDLVNQLPDDLKEDTLKKLSQMSTFTDNTKKDLKDAMLSTETVAGTNEVLQRYKATERIVNEFHQFCLTLKETPDFWDRTSFFIEAISQLAMPLLTAWDKETLPPEKVDTIINSMKSDLMKIYTTRYFLRDINQGKTSNQFKDELNKEIPAKIDEFNKSSSAISKIDINQIDSNTKTGTIADFNSQLISVFEKIDKFKENQEFIDKMWDNFVKDFLQKAPRIGFPRGANKYQWEGKEIELEEYKAWFFEHLFNIAYHTADYIESNKEDGNPIYYFNYNLLKNNFDIENTAHDDFQLNHIEKSTTYSNLVYKWADELGIKHLKILVEKYLIKP